MDKLDMFVLVLFVVSCAWAHFENNVLAPKRWDTIDNIDKENIEERMQLIVHDETRLVAAHAAHLTATLALLAISIVNFAEWVRGV